MKRKILLPLVLVFVVYYVATAPTEAAGVVHEAGYLFTHVADAMATFGQALS